ncbi:cell division protein DivIVA [Brachybacterium endophyticum]|uniref:Cell wall synthesis protein Wag31 n=1 Tax=Brachybacterium endophyticum TaxID=2182385 RepID=A0A2U2RLP8_9MICO|nr:DivIVA domain-containing protein [Brachybacterium endophyticum]PWH06798.1 cell division protein DivIVA [Brachybacterium endophyticum]
MALMPEDLENKRFTPVRFSEGYDMDEVDNYLDLEVLPRLQELIDENSRLTKELEEAHNRVAELENAAQESEATAGAAGAGAGAAGSSVAAETDTADADETVVAGSEQAAAEPESGTTAAVADTSADATAVEGESTEGSAPTGSAPTSEAAVPVQDGDQSAAGIIALANRLHDEYVRNGEDERDRLISEANAEHKRIVTEAEEKSRTTLADLETQKGDLEKSIEKLRTFERDYRSRLRNYLENQLQELETSETQDKQANFGL